MARAIHPANVTAWPNSVFVLPVREPRILITVIAIAMANQNFHLWLVQKIVSDHSGKTHESTARDRPKPKTTHTIAPPDDLPQSQTANERRGLVEPERKPLQPFGLVERVVPTPGAGVPAAAGTYPGTGGGFRPDGGSGLATP